jgi:hypothetical protein
MIMKKTSVFLFGLATILLASGISAFAQEKTVFEKEVTTGFSFQGPGQGEAGRLDTFTFVNSEFSFDKLVKGAPYSAQAVTEMTQILSDGNRILNTSTAAVYRDGEGRTRREQTLKAIGNFSAAGEPFQTISINDPVAGVAYVLEPHSHAARKIQAFRVEPGSGDRIRSPGGEGGAFTINTTTNGAVTVNLRGTDEAKVREELEVTASRKPRVEDLGSQAMEGVTAVGTRTTFTIPAGQIGNERAIEVVDERWFSPDLQTIVMTRHSDPRSGETVYRLTNISRAEPDHSLFEVPADYKLRDDSENMRYRTERPAKPEQQW